MCGIFGRIGSGWTRWQAEAAAATAARQLRHRGPDGQAALVEEGVLLGSTRLAIMDPANGGQPFTTPSGQTVVFFNGEIYNWRALAADLAVRGRVLTSRCDGAVLPHLYELYGDAFLPLLDGMFALAVWDRRRRRLLLAVDRMAIKPLYLMADAGVFASELRVLPGLTGRPLELEPGAVSEYLCLKAVYPPRTIYRGVQKLSGGTWWAWEDGQVRSGRYWAPSALVDTGAHGDDLRGQLADAVSTCLEADRPVAGLVSGGMDSALVAALAGPGLPLFCVGYPGEPPEDERRYARLLAAHMGADLTEVEVGPAQVPDLLAQVVQALEEPIADPVTLPTAAVLGALGRAHRVVLTGDGSDELFGGYARYRALLHGDHAGYLGALCAFHPAELPAFGSAPGAHRSAFGPALGARRSALGPDSGAPDAPWLPPRAGLAAIMAWEQAGRLPAYHLVRVDKLSMAASVEARVPFLRNAIVDAAAQLPPNQIISMKSEKLALRKAADGLIPPEILARPKQPFTFPVYRWLQGPLRSWATDLLLDPRSCIDQLLPRPFVQGLVDQLGAGNPAAPPRIWSLLQLDGLGRHYLPTYGRRGR